MASLLSEEDARWLVQNINALKDVVINRSRPPTEHQFAEGEDHQAPEVYIGLPQDYTTRDTVVGTGTGTETETTGYTGTGTGTAAWREQRSLIIPGLTRRGGPDERDIVQSRKVDLHNTVLQGSDLELRPLGGQSAKTDYPQEVYNPYLRSVVNDYGVCIRDKHGRYIVIPPSHLVRVMLADANHPGRGIKFSVWPGTWCPKEAKWRFDCNDTNNKWDAIDWFYGGTSYDPTTLAMYGQLWAQPMPYDTGKDGIIYDVICSDCESDNCCDISGTGSDCPTDGHELPCTENARGS